MPSKVFIHLALVIVAFTLGGLPVAAQNTAIRIDSENSTARLFLASSKNPDINVNVGVARVNGEVQWSAEDPARSVFDFTVYPAGEKEPGIGPDDKKPPKELPETANYTVITFRSKRVVPVMGGSLRVTGDLTISLVERIASYAPSEAYSGPIYGPAILHSVTREATFVFQHASTADTSVKGDTATWVASSVVVGEDFPELLNAVAATDWPVFVSDEHCVMPPNVGEDFSGPVCTGKTVDPLPRTDMHCAMPSTLGEGFSGEVCTGTPLEVATNGGTQNGMETRHHKGDAKEQLLAAEVEFQLALQVANTDFPHGGTSGQ